LILLQIFCVFVLGFEIALAGDNDHIGKVKTVQPEANILWDDAVLPAVKKLLFLSRTPLVLWGKCLLHLK